MVHSCNVSCLSCKCKCKCKCRFIERDYVTPLMRYTSMYTKHYSLLTNIQCESKTFCNIFTQVEYISVKFCQYVASLYRYIVTNFRWFILIFNKMALIFSRFLTFSVSSFIKSNRRIFIANNEWSPVYPTLIHWIINQAWGNVEVLLQAATEAETVPKFTDVLWLIWSALPEKAIDNAVKDNSNWLQACVSAVEILNM